MINRRYEKGYGQASETGATAQATEMPRHIRAEELAAAHPCPCGCGGLRDRDQRPPTPGIGRSQARS